MQASTPLFLRLLLLPIVVAAFLAAPCALAKKDLFAEPSAKNTATGLQLVPANSTTSEDAKIDDKTFSEHTAIKSNEAIETSAQYTEKHKETLKETVIIHKDLSTSKESILPTEPTTKEPSLIEAQFARLKRNISRTKNDLFGTSDSNEKKTIDAQTIEPQLSESAPIEPEIKSETGTISATEAAQRAQALAEGQVINIRKYYEDGMPRYAIKLLQKNGRMKTITLNAINGAPIEATAQ